MVTRQQLITGAAVAGFAATIGGLIATAIDETRHADPPTAANAPMRARPLAPDGTPRKSQSEVDAREKRFHDCAEAKSLAIREHRPIAETDKVCGVTR